MEKIKLLHYDWDYPVCSRPEFLREIKLQNGYLLRFEMFKVIALTHKDLGLRYGYHTVTGWKWIKTFFIVLFKYYPIKLKSDQKFYPEYFKMKLKQ